VAKQEHLSTADGFSTTTMENSTGIPQKLKIALPYDTAIPFLDIYPKKLFIFFKEVFSYPRMI
jgi:hypothetical protein